MTVNHEVGGSSPPSGAMKSTEIKIQRDLSQDQIRRAITHINRFIVETIKDDGRYCGASGGGRRSYLRRGRFGYLLDTKQNDLTFRRISRNKRIFAVVHVSTLLDKETGKPVNLDRCMCPHHLGGTKVKWKNEPEFFTHFKTDGIKYLEKN